MVSWRKRWIICTLILLSTLTLCSAPITAGENPEASNRYSTLLDPPTVPDIVEHEQSEVEPVVKDQDIIFEKNTNETDNPGLVKQGDVIDTLMNKYNIQSSQKNAGENNTAEPASLSGKYYDSLLKDPEAFHESDDDDFGIGQGVMVFDSESSEYSIGPGDILDISVWKDPALSKVVTVLPDGIISLPLIGEIKASEKKLRDLKKEIEDRISHYIPDPVISISVHQVNSMMIYIIGKVNHPGRFVINSNINVLQALSMAGGLNPFAKSDKIKIFRDDETFLFKYKEVSEGINLSQNIKLERGDIIVIP